MLEDKEIGYLLHKADMAAKSYFMGRLNEFGLTPGQFSVIKEIYLHHKNTGVCGLAPACIAEKMGCDRPTITGIIDRLEAQEWIVRLQNPDDKRSCLVQLTEKAVNNYAELDKISKEHQTMILEGFTGEEAKLFKDYLHRVLNRFWDWRNG